MKKYVLLSIFSLFLLTGLSAQIAVEMETLLNTPAVSYKEAARFVLEASDVAKITSQADAFKFAMDKHWLPWDAEPDMKAQLDGLCLLLMSAFKLKGGILYFFFQNPHYAYREMVYKELIQGKADPKMTVSGSQLLFLTNKILALGED